tara:strand:+ start:322 stop:735 length:414 start_codon:yes stop_codon:yes gene_type:complete
MKTNENTNGISIFEKDVAEMIEGGFKPALFPHNSARTLLRLATLYRVATPFMKLIGSGRIRFQDAVLLTHESNDYIEVDVKFTDLSDDTEEWLCFRVLAAGGHLGEIERWDFTGPEPWGYLEDVANSFDTKVAEIWG